MYVVPVYVFWGVLLTRGLLDPHLVSSFVFFLFLWKHVLSAPVGLPACVPACLLACLPVSVAFCFLRHVFCVFVLEQGEDKVPVCFTRIPAKELLEKGMADVSPRWLLLGEDKVRATP